MDEKRSNILRDAWRIAKPYWVSEERWAARGLLTTIVVLSLLLVWINVRLNSWRNDFYNTLQNYDESGFFRQLIIFTLLAAAFILIAVYQTYLQQMLQIRWRRWMTRQYLHQWLRHKTYYRLQLDGDQTDNPDQRISEDLALFPQQSLNLSLGLFSNIVQAVSFSFILWNLSGPLAISLGAVGTISIPGYMFWAVILYTIFGTWLTIRLGRPLVGLNFGQQRFEADLRFSLVRLRENTESVAFYGGEDREFTI
ncbi:MAG: Xenobiotic-transporting ATPase, partial [Rhodospirillales bacterium]|nr:Xenobiotic-transporting ATPase [Rhodospirillales bacterium]